MSFCTPWCEGQPHLSKSRGSLEELFFLLDQRGNIVNENLLTEANSALAFNLHIAITFQNLFSASVSIR